MGNGRCTLAGDDTPRIRSVTASLLSFEAGAAETGGRMYLSRQVVSPLGKLQQCRKTEV